MNKEVKAKWIKALRSGEYKQGNLRLRNTDNEFCCLGVLCDLYAKENENGKWRTPRDSITRETYGVEFKAGDTVEDMSCTTLPESVVKWADIREKHIIVKLAKLNDADGCSFKEIADYISRTM